MTAAGLAVAAVGLASGLIGVRAAVGQICGLECVGMLVAMLARLDVYAGSGPHHHAADAVHPA
jgi:hypothetical protein